MAEAEAQATLTRLLHDRDAPPVDNPAEALLGLLGRMQAAVEHLGAKVNELDQLDYTDVNLVKRAHVVVELHARLMGELRRGLNDAARLDLEERAERYRRSVLEREGNMVAGLIRLVVVGLAERLAADGRLPEGFAPAAMDAIRAGLDAAVDGSLVPLVGLWDVASDPVFRVLVSAELEPAGNGHEVVTEVEGSWQV